MYQIARGVTECVTLCLISIIYVEMLSFIKNLTTG